MKLSKEQQQVVDSNSHNLVVTAGAGAGKTRVLSERFLKLLTGNNAIDLRQILTLTFTKKAATEMLDRIRKYLKESKDLHIKNQMEFLASASISTLDSFCSSIVSGYFNKYGLPSNSGVNDKKFKEVTEAAVFDWIIKNSKKPAVAKLIDGYGFKSLLKHLAEFASVNFSLVEQIDFVSLIDKQIKQAQSDFFGFKTEMDRLAREALEIFNSIKDKGKTQKEYLTQYLNAVNSCGEDIEKLLPHFTPDKKNIALSGGNITDPNLIRIKDYCVEFKSHFEKAQSVALFLYNKKNYQELYGLLGELQTECLNKRRFSGLVTFTEVAQMAVDLLQKDKLLRRYYKEKFRYIMIDEFQDNNMLQRDLLFLISEKNNLTGEGVIAPNCLEGDKLFFVGDQKQSIYRFRGADVAVFKSLGDDLKEANGLQLELSTNYRSEPGLIKYFNSFFGKLFKPISGEGLKNYEAEFSPLNYREQKLDEPAFVSIIKIESGGDAASKIKKEAKAVAEKILSWRGVRQIALEKSEGEKSYRPCDFKDFALLLETKTHQRIYESEFQKYGIPFTSLSVTTFFEGPLYRDLKNLFALNLNQKDLVTYMGILRSPFLCLDNNEIFSIIASEKERIKNSTMGEFLYFDIDFDDVTKRLSREVTREGQNSILRMKEIILYLQKYADVLPLTILLDKIWFEFGLCYSYYFNDEFSATVNHFDLFRQLAMKCDEEHFTLSQFFTYLKEVETQKFENPLYYNIEPNSVTIMSIHKSKGLQFPIVILSESSGDSKPEISPTFFYDSNADGLTVFFNDKNFKSKTNWLYLKEQEENICKALAEKKRLLYVALTRAEDHLIVCGSGKLPKENNNKAKEEEKIKNSFKYIEEICNHYLACGDSLKCDKLMVEYKEIRDEDTPLEGRPSLLQSKTTPAILTNKNFQSQLLTYNQKKSVALTSLLTDRENEQKSSIIIDKFLGQLLPEDKSSDSPITFKKLEIDDYLHKNNLQNCFGTLTHNLLEQLHTGVLTDEQLADLELVKNLIDGLQPFEKKQNLVLEEAIKLVSCYRASSDYQEIFSDSSSLIQNSWCEKEFMIYLGEGEQTNDEAYILGRVDMLLEYEDKILVLDYKTDSSTVEIKKHTKQLELYRQAVSSIFPSKKVETKIVWLRAYL